MDEQKNRILKVLIHGSEYYVCEIPYKDLKRRKIYAGSQKELEELAAEKYNFAVKHYLMSVPKEETLGDGSSNLTLETYAEHFISGLRRFGANVLEKETHWDDYYDFSIKDTIRFRYLMKSMVYSHSINRDINTISTAQFESFFRMISEYCSYEDVNDIYYIIKYAYKLAQTAGRTKYDFSEVRNTELYKGVSKYSYRDTKYFMNDEEIKRLIDYCTNAEKNVVLDKKMRYRIAILAFTGLSCQELASIRLKDINLEKRKIYIGNRSVKISDEFADWLTNNFFADEENSDKEEFFYGFDISVSNNKMQSVLYGINSVLRHIGLPESPAMIERSVFMKLSDQGYSNKELSEHFNYSIPQVKNIQKKYREFRIHQNKLDRIVCI